MKRALSSAPALVLLLWNLAAGVPQEQNAAKSNFDEKEVSFKTEDGWVIHGTLSIPAGLTPGRKIPGVVMVHSPAHDRDIYLGGHQIGPNTFAKLSLRSELGDTATLRIDIRGRGKSAEPTEYNAFNSEQRSKISLDVSGAIDFLSRQPIVDPDRIGVVAESVTAEPAVIASYKDRRVRTLVLLSGRLGQGAKDVIASRSDLPVLCLASKEDKIGLADMAEVYKLSTNPTSDLMIYRDIGIGNSMFIMYANKFPNEKPLETVVADWVVPRLRASARDVSFRTDDGWNLYGTLRMPQSANQPKAPGVVLVHSYLTDRHVFDNLEQLLSAAGFVVLNFDFRGRGKSQEKGNYFDLPIAERDKAYLDVKAALEFLAAQTAVNSDRLALVTTSIGVKYGLKAACSDSRVKSFVMLGGMPDRADVEKSKFPILFVSTLGLPPIAQAFRDFYKMAKDHGSTLLEYEGGSIGYQLFDLDENLQPFIVKWLKPQLSL
ncbi:MAG TPA: alpha/beta fold hydrolase [Blastocatellia bacterium]|nr:alpha/beta fold hydrolase [Blastocatellia bacterium]